jgi:hypothetical protein
MDSMHLLSSVAYAIVGGMGWFESPVDSRTGLRLEQP